MQPIAADQINDFIALQYLPGNSTRIQVQCSLPEREEMFSRIKGQWTTVGESEPYHSVLSDPDQKFKMKNIEKNRDEFHASGRVGIQNLLSVSEKNGVSLPRTSLLELGCGVGRSTRFFAPEFAAVYGWDISPGNIRECDQYLAESGITNVSLKRIESLSDFDAAPCHDVFFSEIVLQHNPPPIQHYVLDRVLSKLNPGGVFYFQTITHHATYAFNAQSYLRWQHEGDFEMHALPMRWITKILKNHGLLLLDVLKDRSGGFNLDSYTFFGIREP